MLRATAAMIAASMFLLVAFAAGTPTATPSTNATGVGAAACADDSEILGLLIAEEHPSRDDGKSCAKLAALHACDHPTHGPKIRAACPVSCGACPSKCDDATSTTLIDAEQSEHATRAQALAAAAAATDINTTAAVPGDDDDDDGSASFTAQQLLPYYRKQLAAYRAANKVLANAVSACAGLERLVSVDICPAYMPSCKNVGVQRGASVGDTCAKSCEDWQGMRWCPTTSDHSGDTGTPWGWCAEKPFNTDATDAAATPPDELSHKPLLEQTDACGEATARVYGAGTAEVNGFYKRQPDGTDGDENGKPQYQHCSNDKIKIRWDDEWGIWVNGDLYYWNKNTAAWNGTPTLPSSGWEDGTMRPAPSATMLW